MKVYILFWEIRSLLFLFCSLSRLGGLVFHKAKLQTFSSVYQIKGFTQFLDL